jgi:SAM-dependent methyltransferase/DNA-directed RNA polymerase subunit RPC12/RpoP
MQSLAATIAVGGIQPVQAGPDRSAQRSRPVELQCSTCGAELIALPYYSLGQASQPIMCASCSSVLKQKQGIWSALAQNRQKHFARFLREYELVRKAEGRGSDDADFYCSLPFCDRTNRNSWQWSIRARTYRYFERRILPTLMEGVSQPATILDLGAGNGWLSYRLANLGHRPIAVDLQSNTFDGLGAAVHYLSVLPTLFPRFQAELDRLPFGDGQFDCAVFNASFHYSENYDVTLSEAIRCLRPGGTIVIADSPSYSHEESGLKMLEERRKSFQTRFGFRSDALASCEYLTSERLLALEAKHDLEWTTHQPWYGVRWACRPMIARVSKRREPSQFRIYTARVKTQ